MTDEQKSEQEQVIDSQIQMVQAQIEQQQAEVAQQKQDSKKEAATHRLIIRPLTALIVLPRPAR
ncbi:hypothetical protein LU631_19665 [Erwinia tracheiphila]|nr:FlxA-like family protein [Erwinia tracheiphila]UIA90156.1 hypothetical protein LU631_19665 [Erwinia tracheiphila]UIA98681.1 hypothetical protein LU633_18120 [Erwinia tracheiphila]